MTPFYQICGVLSRVGSFINATAPIRFSARFTAPCGNRERVWHFTRRHTKRSNRDRRRVTPVAGVFLLPFLWPLDRETPSRHTVGGTWLARIRAVLALGQREDFPTHRAIRTENDCPLSGLFGRRFCDGIRATGTGTTALSAGGVNSLATRPSGFDSRIVHPEDNGFPFFLISMEPVERSYFLLGGSLVLCSFLPFAFPFPPCEARIRNPNTLKSGRAILQWSLRIQQKPSPPGS